MSREEALSKEERRIIVPMNAASIRTALACVAVSLLCSPPAEGATTTYRDLRYEDVIGQTTPYTCGPAAVATLLTHYYGLPTSEPEAVGLAERFMFLAGREPGEAITALALKQSLEALGLPTKGIRVTPEALRDYLIHGGLPLIIHVTQPQKHFLVAVGMVGDSIVLADPSWGRRIVPFESFVTQRAYSEIVLAIIPPPHAAERPEIRQKETLAWATSRLRSLASLRENLP